jgi:hypothetical protein
VQEDVQLREQDFGNFQGECLCLRVGLVVTPGGGAGRAGLSTAAAVPTVV